MSFSSFRPSSSVYVFFVPLARVFGLGFAACVMDRVSLMLGDWDCDSLSSCLQRVIFISSLAFICICFLCAYSLAFSIVLRCSCSGQSLAWACCWKTEQYDSFWSFFTRALLNFFFRARCDLEFAGWALIKVCSFLIARELRSVSRIWLSGDVVYDQYFSLVRLDRSPFRLELHCLCYD